MTMTEVPAGTGVRDAAAAEFLAVALCAVLAAAAGMTTAGVTGMLVGLGLVAGTGASVASRPGRWSGPADRVTLVRAVLVGGCATVTVLAVAGQLTERPWSLIALLVPALLLDRVDGAVARATGTSSEAGRTLDGELDAALLLVVSVAAVRPIGWWVLAIGLMRYAYWAAGSVLPRLRGWLAFSQFRRVVAGLQGAAFAVALVPVVPVGVGRAVLAVTLGLLVVSFGRDVRTLLSTPARSADFGSTDSQDVEERRGRVRRRGHADGTHQ